MKQNLGYEIDYIESKIIVSKKYLKEARTINTDAYIELAKVRKDYPEFTIEPRQIAKRENKMTYQKRNSHAGTPGRLCAYLIA